MKGIRWERTNWRKLERRCIEVFVLFWMSIRVSVIVQIVNCYVYIEVALPTKSEAQSLPTADLRLLDTLHLYLMPNNNSRGSVAVQELFGK